MAVSPPFTEDFRFTGPGVAISCRVQWDDEMETWVATSSAGFKGAARTTQEAAALACFEGWIAGRMAWFEPEQRCPLVLHHVGRCEVVGEHELDALGHPIHVAGKVRWNA